MNEIRNTVIGSIAATVLVLGIIFFARTEPPTIQVNVPQPEVPVGAVSGPEISSPYLIVNGVRTEYRSMKFSTSSTTRCALQSPTDKASVLSLEGIVSSATTTDYTLHIAKSATQYATTTQIRQETVTSNSAVVFPTASSTQSSLSDTNRIFAAGEWLVVSTAGPTATAFDSGSCAATFSVAP
jgi:hypothetical protein